MDFKPGMMCGGAEAFWHPRRFACSHVLPTRDCNFSVVQWNLYTGQHHGKLLRSMKDVQYNSPWKFTPKDNPQTTDGVREVDKRKTLLLESAKGQQPRTSISFTLLSGWMNYWCYFWSWLLRPRHWYWVELGVRCGGAEGSRYPREYTISDVILIFIVHRTRTTWEAVALHEACTIQIFPKRQNRKKMGFEVLTKKITPVRVPP